MPTMADNFANFYSGAMAPPDRMPDGSLVPSQNTSSSSIADMYRGIYGPAPATGEGLNVRTVKTVPITIDGLAARPATQTASAAPTQQQMQAMRENTVPLPSAGGPAGPRLAAGPANPFQIGPAYPFGYSPNAQNSAVNAINDRFGGYVAKPRFASSLGAMYDDVSVNAPPAYAPNMAAADPWGKMRITPGTQQPGFAYGKPAAAAPVPKPTGLLDTIASMFTPPAPTGQPAYTTTPFQESAFQTTTGAMMPSSMNNSRWTTGY
jgi:hypothetical protein